MHGKDKNYARTDKSVIVGELPLQPNSTEHHYADTL